MRRLSTSTLLPAVAALAIAGCGGGSNSSGSAGGSASTTSESPAVISKAGGYNPNPKGAIKNFKKKPIRHTAKVPPVPTVEAGCKGLPALRSSTGSATKLKAKLDTAIAHISAYLGPKLSARPVPPKQSRPTRSRSGRRHLPPPTAQHPTVSHVSSEKLRARELLFAMQDASKAAARYIAAPSSAARQALVTAVTTEQNTAAADAIAACAIPKS